MYLTLYIYINTKGNNIGICKFKKILFKLSCKIELLEEL